MRDETEWGQRGKHMRISALQGATEGEAELTQCSTPFTFFAPSSTLEARISMTWRSED